MDELEPNFAVALIESGLYVNEVYHIEALGYISPGKVRGSIFISRHYSKTDIEFLRAVGRYKKEGLELEDACERARKELNRKL